MEESKTKQTSAFKPILDLMEPYKPLAIQCYEKIKPYLPVFKTRNWWSIYDHIVYNLDLIVPDPDPEKIDGQEGFFVQEVHIGKKIKWRAMKDPYSQLPEHFKDGLTKREDKYYVISESNGVLPLLDNNSKFIKNWDIVMLLLLLWTATVIPFEVSFREQDLVDVLFFMNRIVDVLFLIDMFVQCLRPYKDERSGRLVTNRKLILKRYAYSWLLVDLISIIPFELFYSSLNGSSTKDLSLLRLLRFLRLARLLKLLRVLKASKKLRDFKGKINLRTISMQLMNTFIHVLFMIHWLACGFKLFGDQFSPSDPFGWPHYVEINFGRRGVWQYYLYSIYWASNKIAMSSTSVDVLQPHTDREYAYAFLANILIFGFIVYSIATLCDVFVAVNKKSREVQMRIDSYLDMFQRLRIKNTLKNRIQEYWEDHENVETISSTTKLLQSLPTQLRSYISVTAFVHFLEKIPYLEPFLALDPLLVSELASGVKVLAFSPHSNVFAGKPQGIYYVEKGVIAIEGKVYPSGSVIGLNCLRTNVKKCTARALSFVSVLLISVEFLEHILEEYPPIKKFARKWTLWDAVRSYLRAYGRAYYGILRRAEELGRPITTRRPNMEDHEDDDVDTAVMERLAAVGY